MAGPATLSRVGSPGRCFAVVVTHSSAVVGVTRQMPPLQVRNHRTRGLCNCDRVSARAGTVHSTESTEWAQAAEGNGGRGQRGWKVELHTRTKKAQYSTEPNRRCKGEGDRLSHHRDISMKQILKHRENVLNKNLAPNGGRKTYKYIEDT